MTNKTRSSEIQQLRQELQTYRFYVVDDELRSDIKEWIQEAQSLNAGSVQEFVRGELMQMRSEHPMRWVPELQRAEEGFPSECSGCEHVKRGSCPVVTDRERRRSRKRRLEQAETEADARKVWEEISVRTGCKRIPEWLEEWGSEHQEFIKRGHRLLDRVEDLTQDATEDAAELPEELQNVGEQDEVMAFGGGDA